MYDYGDTPDETTTTTTTRPTMTIPNTRGRGVYNAVVPEEFTATAYEKLLDFQKNDAAGGVRGDGYVPLGVGGPNRRLLWEGRDPRPPTRPTSPGALHHPSLGGGHGGGGGNGGRRHLLLTPPGRCLGGRSDESSRRSLLKTFLFWLLAMSDPSSNLSPYSWGETA